MAIISAVFYKLTQVISPAQIHGVKKQISTIEAGGIMSLWKGVYKGERCSMFCNLPKQVTKQTESSEKAVRKKASKEATAI